MQLRNHRPKETRMRNRRFALFLALLLALLLPATNAAAANERSLIR